MRLHRAMVLIQVSWRFPFLSPLKIIYLLFIMMGHSHIREHSRQQLKRRIQRQGAVEHLDFIEQLIPADHIPPKGSELRHLEQVAGQLLLAGYEPPSLWFYFTVYHLVQNRSALSVLTREIRSNFKSYEEITATSSADLPYLTACLNESLRFTPPLLTGMPVTSPGAMVDGIYVPKGVRQIEIFLVVVRALSYQLSQSPQVVCQSSLFALARGPRNFREPLKFRPERWATSEDSHAPFDSQFNDDDLKGFHPFSQGPRMCSGKEIAWWQIRVFVAKTLWKFDLYGIPGAKVDMDRDLRGWGMYEKPDFHVRFVRAKHT